jgi:hypothetical protein
MAQEIRVDGAFGRVRDLLFVCPWPYPQEVNRTKRSLRVEELKSARLDTKKKRQRLIVECGGLTPLFLRPRVAD